MCRYCLGESVALGFCVALAFYGESVGLDFCGDSVASGFYDDSLSLVSVMRQCL